MNKRTKDRLKILENRMRFLEKRIEVGKQSGRDLSYDKAEACTLRWALDILHNIHGSTFDDSEQNRVQ